MIHKILLLVFFLLHLISVNAQENKYKNNRNMENSKSALRLIYPQWQGGVVTSLLPELNPDDASR